jgi:hypothetical protein
VIDTWLTSVYAQRVPGALNRLRNQSSPETDDIADDLR